jgi:ubiquitin carboxyl-terminal hydrolase 8
MKGNGLTGLSNVGNSCYLNACVQILSHTHELSNFLENEEYKKRLNKIADSVLLVEWDKLRRLMWSEDCTIAPWGFVNAVKKVSTSKGMSLFSGFQQNDVSEFLNFLLEAFHMALARGVEMSVKGKVKTEKDKLAKECYSMMKSMYEKEYSELLTMFYGISVSRVLSEDGKEVLSIRPEPFSTLTLDIPDIESPTIFDCFENYCKGEVLKDENAYYNEKTKTKVSAMRRFSFWSLPPVLIIGLKRFVYSPSYRKVNKLVTTPLINVDFSKYTTGYGNNKAKYNLFGVCNHMGGIHGGHYTAYAKAQNNQWYSFNDTMIGEVKEERVITTASYYLFYRKIK